MPDYYNQKLASDQDALELVRNFAFLKES